MRARQIVAPRSKSACAHDAVELLAGALLDAAHVRVDGQHVAPEREVADGRRGVRPDARELGQVVRPAVLRDLLRGAVQAERAPVVAEPLPLDDHLAGDAAASASTVGHRSSHACQRGITRSTCVCCSITSLTRIAYGSVVSRHGRGARFAVPGQKLSSHRAQRLKRYIPNISLQSDPVLVLRALAHPLRLRLLQLAAAEGVITSTTASKMTGESTANCSFHLRLLARYGFLEQGGAGRSPREAVAGRGESAARGDLAAARRARPIRHAAAPDCHPRPAAHLRSRPASARSVRVSCDRGELAAGLAVVGRAASARTAVAVLGGIKIVASAGGLSLTATDMEISLGCHLPADVEREGVVIVPGKSLLELVRRMPAGPLVLEAADDAPELALGFGSADYRLATLSARDFPDIAARSGGEQVTLDRSAFVETVASVARAASRDESRPVYTGISMTVADGSLTLAATDGHRLAVKTTPVDADVELTDLLIPARALEELARLPTSDSSLVIRVTENRVAFDVGGFSLTSRRLDGRFQPYESLLNGAFAHVATVSREPLLEAVERAMVMVSEQPGRAGLRRRRCRGAGDDRRAGPRARAAGAHRDWAVADDRSQRVVPSGRTRARARRGSSPEDERRLAARRHVRIV